MKTNKELVEEYLEIHQDLKKVCYDLSIHFFEVCRKHSISHLFYDLSSRNFEDLEFNWDGEGFNIGYTSWYASEDSRYFNHFTEEEISNPELIQKKVDLSVEKQKQQNLLREKMEEDLKNKTLQQERELYLKLKQKYESNNSEE